MYASARISLKKITASIIVTAGILVVFPVYAQQDTDIKPIGHIELSNPADLTKQQAEQIYLSVLPDIKAIFAMSDIGTAAKYTSWKRYNNAPYISATHGARYVDNYANEIAKDYGQLKPGETYPIGSILAKDSFSVTSDRSIFPGALFLMEKMGEGFNKPSGNWKYTMVLPDGSVFGTTNGENSENVEFCIGCHAAKAALDHIFFVPKGYGKDP
ncbi:cytochrome P460 family protein [Sneathiella marina]|uniref:Cytochrome P460 family protein n=1 Tax=Sneathiella marina TaxID=2950108 RepID=A0ABY4VZC8_9PROT|nr:cytochrome P460 family protein [Sneathiella marina]USG60037.1 cytochrome P460 family protein [Sneathiella marina]